MEKTTRRLQEKVTIGLDLDFGYYRRYWFCRSGKRGDEESGTAHHLATSCSTSGSSSCANALTLHIGREPSAAPVAFFSHEPGSTKGLKDGGEIAAIVRRRRLLIDSGPCGESLIYLRAGTRRRGHGRITDSVVKCLVFLT